MKIETLQTADGPMDVHIATPAGAGPHPAVVVVQEAFGVNRNIEGVCTRLAAEGFVAAAPEIFHRHGKNLLFGYDEFPKLRPIFATLTNDALVSDIAATLAFVRARPDVRAKSVGITGFCVGGFATFLAATRLDVAAAVAYYGGGMVNARPGFLMSPPLPDAKNLRAPILFFFGKADQSIPPSDVAAVREALERERKSFEIVEYEGAGHGFACDERASFQRDASEDAWKRTVAFFRRHLSTV